MTRTLRCLVWLALGRVWERCRPSRIWEEGQGPLSRGTGTPAAKQQYQFFNFLGGGRGANIRVSQKSLFPSTYMIIIEFPMRKSTAADEILKSCFLGHPSLHLNKKIMTTFHPPPLHRHIEYLFASLLILSAL